MTSLRQRMTEDMQVRNLSPHTQACISAAGVALRPVLPQVAGRARPGAHPRLPALPDEREEAGDHARCTDAIGALHSSTASPSTGNGRFDEILPFPKAPKHWPSFSARRKSLHFLGCVESHKHRRHPHHCYAAGSAYLRSHPPEGQRHRRQRIVLPVEQGKGRKDRYVMLSPDCWRS